MPTKYRAVRTERGEKFIEDTRPSAKEIERGLGMRRRHKYNMPPAEDRTYNGIVFDSPKEMNRWIELSAAANAGIIRNLERQVPFDLFACELKTKKPVKIGQYKADFVYRSVETGKTVIEDVKGYRPKEWPRTKKLFEACYNLRIVET